MKVVFPSFASPFEAALAEVSGVDELSDDVFHNDFLSMVGYLFYSPAQQSGTSEVFDELLSVCSLFLQQSGTSESVDSLSLQQSFVVLWL